MEAAEAARRREAARAAEKAKLKDQADKQKAERHKHAQNMKVRPGSTGNKPFLQLWTWIVAMKRHQSYLLVYLMCMGTCGA